MTTNPPNVTLPVIEPTCLGIAEYCRIACLRNDLNESNLLLLQDQGLPPSEWTAAHETAVMILSRKYNEKAMHVARKRPAAQAWMSPFTFTKGGAAQSALSRTCALITGTAQRALRERVAQREANKAAEQARLQALNAMSPEEKAAETARALRSGISSVFQGFGARIGSMAPCEVDALREGVRYLSLLLAPAPKTDATSKVKTPVVDPVVA